MVSSSSNDEHTQRRMQQEIRDMISTLTRRLTALGKPTSGSDPNRQEAEEGDNGVRIITLAGENKGATMKAAMEELPDTGGSLYSNERAMSAYTNSNYQAVNNSVVLGGGLDAQDPGVHIVISDYVEDDAHEQHEKEEKKEKNKEKKKKSEKEGHGEKSGGTVSE